MNHKLTRHYPAPQVWLLRTLGAAWLVEVLLSSWAMVNDSQVSYRAMVATYEAWTPHRVWLDGYSSDGASRDFEPPGDSPMLDCQELLYAGGKLRRDGGAHPSQVVAADLAKIRRKHATQ